MPNVKYYNKAREYFKSRHKNVKFVVLTSPDLTSRKWCKDNLINKTNDTFLLPENAVEIDMFILINSDHVIISTGTFGWWGAWLNKKATVVKWNNLSGDRKWNSSDIYPDHWILLDGPDLGNYKHYKKWLSV
ncbi:hypothetical protein FSP39_013004 [Pinctada imbricata]|uniref:L-Fucosyltransferase n=1 Tax=Pinctada imbricata TaxID=66713 RepID=A0AA88YGV7_PINIB|nr:hypothetical protein FSP39_013004 [Pinctada imbricata]